MKKGSKTEQTNRNISVAKQEGIAGRLAGHVDKITGYLNDIGEKWNLLGAELKLIRDEGDFAGTFEEFIKETFNKTRGWAYQFIQGYEAKLSLPESVQHEVQNPRQALALAMAPVEKRAKVMETVKESGKKVTAKEIEKEVKKQEVKDADVVELDELGNKIPAEILPEWNRAKEEAKWARGSINEIARWFRDGLGDGGKRDPIFRAVTLSNKKLFDDIKRQIAMVNPYCVCPTCKGSAKVDGKKCPHCKGTGFISKFEYEHVDTKAKPKKKDNEKPAKITQRFATFIEHAHNGSAISVHWDVDKGRGEVELKDGTNLAFEEKDGEFKLIPVTEDIFD